MQLNVLVIYVDNDGLTATREVTVHNDGPPPRYLTQWQMAKVLEAMPENMGIIQICVSR